MRILCETKPWHLITLRDNLFILCALCVSGETSATAISFSSLQLLPLRGHGPRQRQPLPVLSGGMCRASTGSLRLCGSGRRRTERVQLHAGPHLLLLLPPPCHPADVPSPAFLRCLPASAHQDPGCEFLLFLLPMPRFQDVALCRTPASTASFPCVTTRTN